MASKTVLLIIFVLAVAATAAVVMASDPTVGDAADPNRESNDDERPARQKYYVDMKPCRRFKIKRILLNLLYHIQYFLHLILLVIFVYVRDLILCR